MRTISHYFFKLAIFFNKTIHFWLIIQKYYFIFTNQIQKQQTNSKIEKYKYKSAQINVTTTHIETVRIFGKLIKLIQKNFV